MRTAPWWRCCGHCLGRLEQARLPPAAATLTHPLPLAGAALGWLLQPTCPYCGCASEAGDRRAAACATCEQTLALPEGGLHGLHPLPWWGAGRYEQGLRRLLLRLRQRPREAAVAALVRQLRPGLPARLPHALLVPIPGWKRPGNPLPALLCSQLQRQLGLSRAELLQRHHAVVGQHHLGRLQRQQNQQGAFLCRRPPLAGQARRRPLLLVDDILTSGATALSATATLEASGWRVAGLLCLARTPLGRDRL